MRRILAGLGLALCVNAAQGADVPVTVAPVDLPNLNFAPTSFDERRYDDYFYFHKDGVSFDVALADIKECEALSQVTQQPVTPLPDFIPMGGYAPDSNANGRAMMNALMMWGVVGGVMAAVLLDDMETDMSNSNLRRCMGYHGYTRHGTTRTIWKALSKGTLDVLEQRLAMIASGPAPAQGAIAP